MEVSSVLLEHGHQAYIVGYSVVHLLEIAVKGTKRSKEWKVFQCIKEGGDCRCRIAPKKEWCKISERHMGFCGFSFSFLHFFWPTLSITPFLVDSYLTPDHIICRYGIIITVFLTLLHPHTIWLYQCFLFYSEGGVLRLYSYYHSFQSSATFQK